MTRAFASGVEASDGAIRDERAPRVLSCVGFRFEMMCSGSAELGGVSDFSAR
jgi:hypothetical protein